MFSRQPIKKIPKKQNLETTIHLPPLKPTSSVPKSKITYSSRPVHDTKPAPIVTLPPINKMSAVTVRPAPDTKPAPKKQTFGYKLPPIKHDEESASEQSADTSTDTLSGILSDTSSDAPVEITAAHTSTPEENLNPLFDKYEMPQLKSYKHEIIELEPHSDESGKSYNRERHPDWGRSNCHGYTFNEDTSHSIEASEFIEHYEESDGKHVAVFLRGNRIAHSGILEDNSTLRHLLIGIGILRTDIGADGTLGYDRRFNLPEQLDLLRPYHELAEIQSNMPSLMGGALSNGTFTSEELIFLGDGATDYEKIYNKMHDKIDAFLEDEDVILDCLQSGEEPEILRIYRRISSLSLTIHPAN